MTRGIGPGSPGGSLCAVVTRLGRLRTLTLGVTLVILVAGCGGDDRPSVAEWRPIWVDVIADVPSAEDLGDPPDRGVCSEALGLLRSRSEELSPTPDQAIDGVVTEWIRVAEDLLFECPPSSDRIPDLAFAYSEMFRLQAEVDAVLAIDEATE